MKMAYRLLEGILLGMLIAHHSFCLFAYRVILIVINHSQQNADAWDCGVCQFVNTKNKKACDLCGTEKGKRKIHKMDI